MIFIPIVLVVERIVNKELLNCRLIQDKASEDKLTIGTIITKDNLESIKNDLERAFAQILLSQSFRILHDVEVGGRVIDFCIESPDGGTPRKAFFEIKESPRNRSKSTRTQKKALRESGYPYDFFYRSDLSNPEQVLTRVYNKLLQHNS